jgi:uncharacterized protein YndB with AHSA1/START domain
MDLTADELARTVISTRVFDAPPDQVFDAYANPEKLVRWWGPNGFTITTEHIDLREGGKWKFIFHGPDGREYKNLLEFKVLERPRKFVVHHQTGPYYLGTVIFSDLGGQTHVTMYWTFDDANFVLKQRNAVEEGNEGNFDRLGEVIAGKR